MHPGEVNLGDVHEEYTNDIKTQCRMICFIVTVQIVLGVTFFFILKLTERF